MTWFLAGLLIGVIAAAWFGFERQRQVYEQMVALLDADREAARNEAKVFRGLLFPSINKAEANLGDVGKGPAQISGEGSPTTLHTSPKGTSARSRARVSTRQWFNMMRKQTNTPQQSTDALADAIRQVQKKNSTQVPSQEKSHA